MPRGRGAAHTDAERIKVEVDGDKVILKVTARRGLAPGGGWAAYRASTLEVDNWPDRQGSTSYLALKKSRQGKQSLQCRWSVPICGRMTPL